MLVVDVDGLGGNRGLMVVVGSLLWRQQRRSLIDVIDGAVLSDHQLLDITSSKTLLNCFAVYYNKQ